MRLRLTLWTALGISMAAGAEEPFASNEQAAIHAVKTYAEAQDIYRRTDWDADAVLEYAQTIRGANSLYEKNAGAGDLQLVEQAFAMAEGVPVLVEDKDIPQPSEEERKQASALIVKLADEDFQTREAATQALKELGPGAIRVLQEAAKVTQDLEARMRCETAADAIRARIGAKLNAGGKQAVPSHGYCFRVLTGQGEKAPGGKKSYIHGGNLVLGYAIVAFPAQYGKTGKRSFIINNTGTVYAKDLGEETVKTASAMTEYLSGDGWKVAE